MPIIKKGSLTATLAELQPGAKLTYSEYGYMEGSAEFRCDKARVLSALATVRATPHPFDRRAVCRSVDVTQEGLEVFLLSATYIGLERSPTTPEYAIQGAMSQESITTHPDFVSKIGGTAAAPKNNAVYDSESGLFQFFPPDATGELGGVDSYLVPSVCVAITFFQNASPNGRQLGTIEGAPGYGIVVPTSCKNWLMTSWTPRQIAKGVWQITQQLTGSGPKGWNRLIYGR